MKEGSLITYLTLHQSKASLYEEPIDSTCLLCYKKSASLASLGAVAVGRETSPDGDIAKRQRTGQFHVPCHEHHVEMRLTDIVPQTIALDRAQFFCPLILPDTQQ